MKLNNYSRGEGAPFLVELMAVILFLALSSSVILSLFVKADARSKDAVKLSGAMSAAMTAAELVRTSGDPVTDFIYEYGAMMDGSTYECYLDASFVKGGYDYLLCLDVLDKTGGLYRMKVSVREGNETIYSLDCASYTGGDA